VLDGAGRTAHVQVRFFLLRGQQGRRIEFLRSVAVVVMKLHARRERRIPDPLAKSGAASRARAIAQLELGIAARQHLGHGQDRRDADSARQKVLRRAGTKEKWFFGTLIRINWFRFTLCRFPSAL
jgi:hypothetical protein